MKRVKISPFNKRRNENAGISPFINLIKSEIIFVSPFRRFAVSPFRRFAPFRLLCVPVNSSPCWIVSKFISLGIFRLVIEMLMKVSAAFTLMAEQYTKIIKKNCKNEKNERESEARREWLRKSSNFSIEVQVESNL